MVIKKHPNKNQYVRTPEGLWVRNFTIPRVPYVGISSLMKDQDYVSILDNELENRKHNYVDIGTENIRKEKIVIVSDGYNLSSKIDIIASLPNDVCIIGVNKTLSMWGANNWHTKKPMSYYVINNPFEESKLFLPKTRYYPKCIASTRTHPGFMESYRGNLYVYCPVSEKHYSGPNFFHEYKIDDYRNPICAAIGLAYRFRVNKLLLLCCDDSFADGRPGAEELENGLYTYPQQITSSHLVDANLLWLKNAEISIVNHSSGPKLANAAYIKEDAIKRFFDNE